MTDQRLRELEHRVAADPADASSLERLRHARVSSGLGWHGETLPPRVAPVAGDPGVYAYDLGGGEESGDHIGTRTLRESGLIVAEKPKTPRATLDLVYVPGGDVPCPGDLFNCDRHRAVNGPHAVKIPPFYFGRFPVTCGQWNVADIGLLAHARARFGAVQPGALHPVANVDLRDATAFCAWLGLRLPSEAEWKWAALAGQGQCLVDGHEPDCIGGSARHPWGNETPEVGVHRVGPRRTGREVRIGGAAGSAVMVPELANGTLPVLKETCGKHGAACRGQDCGYLKKFVPARPRSASWCGALDLWHVLETLDDGRVIGGSFRSNEWRARGLEIEEADFGRPHDDVGFRVAISGVTT